jgi:endonuclease III
MASHGGMREGSGRPSGAANKATSELKLNLSELAREYTNDALNTLVDVMQSSQSDSARIAAATAILDRGYGRPTKTTSLEVNAPFVPTEIRLVAYTGSVSD